MDSDGTEVEQTGKTLPYMSRAVLLLVSAFAAATNVPLVYLLLAGKASNSFGSPLVALKSRSNEPL